MFIPGNNPLFEGIAPADVTSLLGCLSVMNRTYAKNETILREGDTIDSIGVILRGFVQIIRYNYEGNRIIQASFGVGAVFAESFVCAGIQKSPVTVLAAEETEILFLPFKKLIRSCESTCTFHYQLIENMMKLIARKNLLLNSKLEIIAKRTIREKVLAYLEQEGQKTDASRFTIPYGRNELADYLCVDRSALSRELGNMQSDGLLVCEGKSFTIVRK